MDIRIKQLGIKVIHSKVPSSGLVLFYRILLRYYSFWTDWVTQAIFFPILPEPWSVSRVSSEMGKSVFFFGENYANIFFRISQTFALSRQNKKSKENENDAKFRKKC